MNEKQAGLRLFTLLVLICTLAKGADWLFKRADPQQTGWQRDEKLLTVRTVKGLRLLWRQRFGSGLTDPLLLGPIVTHRGIKELVFVRDDSDSVYAVDADLGTVFWSRHLEPISGPACAERSRIAPVMLPAVERPSNSNVADDDQFSDANRPLYVLSATGRLYALRLSTGEDFSPPRSFLPSNVKPVSFEMENDVLHAATSPVCGGVPDQVWTLDLKTGTAPQSQPWKGDHQTFTTFQWKGKDLLAGLSSSGQSTLLSVKDGLPAMPGSPRFGGLATWQDATGTRWIDITSPTGVRAFQVTGSEEQPSTQLFWTAHDLAAAGPPVVANNVLYFLSNAAAESGNHLVLHALNALNGKELYNSGHAMSSRSSSGNVALANGHVCLSAADGALYCFGLPFEM